MIRGTTPTLKFILPVSIDIIDVLYITFNQKGSTILEKDISSVEMTGNEIDLKLSQEDTLKFNEGINTEIQIRIKTDSGDALASNIITTSTERILKNGQI